jgi:hypothetical protein
MNKLLVLAVSVGILFSAAVTTAQQAKGPASAGKDHGTQAMQMNQMDDHMKKMQALHDRMMSARTPEERQRAMEDARREMQDGMKTMRPMMKDGGIGGGTMAPGGKSDDANAQMQMMGKRMDMMQMMMQMMMDQQGMTMPPKGSGMTPRK